MIALLLIATIVSVAYPIYAIRILKTIPESLTETRVLLGGMGWLYQAALLLMSLSVLPVWISVSSSYTLHLAVISCLGMLLVTTEQSYFAHCCIVVCSCMSAMLWQIAEGLLIGMIVFGILCLAMSIIKGKAIFWGELAVIYSVLYNIWMQI